MYAHSNVICADNHSDGAVWFGNVFGVTNEKELYNFFDTEDIVTITVNYKDDTIKFNSENYKKEHVVQLKSTTNCIKLVVEVLSAYPINWIRDVTMTIL